MGYIGVSCLLHCLWTQIQLGLTFGVFQAMQPTTQRGFRLRLSILTRWMLVLTWTGEEVQDISNWDFLQLTSSGQMLFEQLQRPWLMHSV